MVCTFFYCIFAQFMQFPVLDFGLVHSGSEPFIYEPRTIVAQGPVYFNIASIVGIMGSCGVNSEKIHTFTVRSLREQPSQCFSNTPKYPNKLSQGFVAPQQCNKSCIRE